MNLKKSVTIAVILFIAAIGSWELYWRSEGYKPNIEDDNALWAVQRAKVNQVRSNLVFRLKYHPFRLEYYGLLC